MLDLPHRYPVRRMAPFSATSSPLDDPGRFGYLHTSLSTLSHSDVLSGVEVAISRNLPQSRLLRLRRAHWRLREIAEVVVWSMRLENCKIQLTLIAGQPNITARGPGTRPQRRSKEVYMNLLTLDDTNYSLGRGASGSTHFGVRF